MTTVARYIGGAGTGKTRLLMGRLSDALERGVDPMRVGFVSFTKAARTEAAARAESVCGIPAKQLTDDGWFKTLHSVCYRALGVPPGQLLTGDKASKEWLRDNVGIDEPADSEDGLESFAQRSDDALALDVWSLSRSRMESLADTVRWLQKVGGDPGDVYEVARRYEEAKRLDDRCDFTDLLARFAGIRFYPDREPEEVTPEGEAPPLHVWFFDEQQDTSPLLDRVCRRLCESATWVYVCGDPFQSLYSFAGSDGRIFQEWQVAKEAIMPQSWRCGPAVHAYGEDCLRLASDYWDRGIQAAPHESVVEHQTFGPWSLNGIGAGESWLVLTRTNYQARKLMARANELGIPWAPSKGLGGWNRPAWQKHCMAAYLLQSGKPIRWADWKSLADKLPSRIDGEQMLERGFKAELAMSASKPRAEHVSIDTLSEAGATERLAMLARSGDLIGLVEDGDRFATLVDQHGPANAAAWLKSPPLRVGTIHSVKGAEADNVLWLTSSTKRIHDACQLSPEAHNEECRVAYVAATRARKRLIVAREPNQRYRMPTP